MSTYNSRLINSYLKYTKTYHPHVDLDEVLSYAKMKPYEVADQGHWFTQEQIDLFYDKLCEKTGSNTIAREAGRYAISPDTLGVLRHYIAGNLSASAFFHLTNRVAEKLTRSSNYTSRKISKNTLEITVTPKPGTNEKHFQCENRIGIFEACIMLVNNSVPQITHKECLFHGGNCCKYTITWKKTKTDSFFLLRNIIISFSFLSYLSTYFILKSYFSIHLLLFFASICFIATIIGETLKNGELRKRLETLSETTEQLVDQVNLNYTNLLLANEVGETISGQKSLDVILESIISILQSRLNYERGIILLANNGRTRLTPRAWFGYQKDQLDFLEKASFQLNNFSSKGALVRTFHDQQPVLVNNLDTISSQLSIKSLNLAKKLGVKAFICCPIVCDNKSLGVLAMENLRSHRPLLQSDLSQLMGIAPVIGIAIRNAELLEAQENLFKSTLKALAASIDARDPLTAGHSEKVTEYAVGICEELDIEPEYREVVRVAALLHDYGKIAVPDAILKKPGKLTLEEREAVKTHAFKTRDILEQISFEGKFKEVPGIAAAHHEKLDGSGYPAGLKGAEIPLGAKIIAVADFFEAITSKRHYREPMPVAAAFQLLRAEAGTHFQKDIVEAFFLWYRSTYAEGRLPEEERRRLRVPFKTSVAISFDGRHHLGHSVDLSTGGAFISTSGTPKEGALVDLAFTLPADSGRVAARGRVAWVNPPPTTKKPTFPAGFGVEFVEFKEQSGAHLHGFLTDTIRSEHVWAT